MNTPNPDDLEDPGTQTAPLNNKPAATATSIFSHHQANHQPSLTPTPSSDTIVSSIV